MWEPNTNCAGRRDCSISDNPCTVCDAMAPELKDRVLRARVRRLRRLARRASSSSSISGSIHHRARQGSEKPFWIPRVQSRTPPPTGERGKSVSPCPGGSRDGDICCVSCPLMSTLCWSTNYCQCSLCSIHTAALPKPPTTADLSTGVHETHGAVDVQVSFGRRTALPKPPTMADLSTGVHETHGAVDVQVSFGRRTALPKPPTTADLSTGA